MIAKILKATSKFLGVAYSEKKVNNGKAVFKGAFNFPFSQYMSIDRYVCYLDRVSECAKRAIKNRQFHAMISAKGREYDEDMLVDIGHRWMKKMGYENQPYLIYFHGDTENNHIHIISSRITLDGERINPYMEGRRAGIAIRELMNEDLKKLASSDIQDILSNYSFSTLAQYRLLLEKRGWRVFKKDDLLNVFKYVNQDSIKIDLVEEKTASYKQNKKRLSQLRAVMLKYSGLHDDAFLKMMHEKFGIEIVFHHAKGHEKPYGYTIIDHAEKSVYKGGEVLSLERLLSSVTREQHRKLSYEVFKETMLSKERVSYNELREKLKANQYTLKGAEVYLLGDKEPLFSLSTDIYKNLRYNARIEEANKFTARDSLEAKILSILFFIQSKDIEIKQDSFRNDQVYRDMVASFEGDKNDLKRYFEEQNKTFISYGGKCYIIDFSTNTIADISNLGFDDEHELSNYQDKYSEMVERNEIFSSTMGVFALLVGLFGQIEQESDSSYQSRDKEEERRKRRRMKNL